MIVKLLLTTDDSRISQCRAYVLRTRSLTGQKRPDQQPAHCECRSPPRTCGESVSVGGEVRRKHEEGQHDGIEKGRPETVIHKIMC